MKKTIARKIFVFVMFVFSFLLIGTFLVSGLTDSFVLAVSGNGGGVYVGSTANVTLSGTTISGNTATNGGGVYVENGGKLTVGDCVYFGSYPKTYQPDTSEITSAQDSNGYYLGEDGTSRYAKVSASPYSSSYVFDDGTKIVSGTEYYFKVEPIRWRIVKNEGKMLLFCEDIIDAMWFDDSTSYSNNYASSEIEAYLNGYSTSYGSSYANNGFLQTAFTTAEQNSILTTTVDNSASTTDNSSNTYACENTKDKIFLLSYQDMINTEYGFSSSTSSDVLRQKQTTDYARANGAYYNTSSSYLYNGEYWLRSPSYTRSYVATYVNYNGSLGGGSGVKSSFRGVVPALYISGSGIKRNQSYISGNTATSGKGHNIYNNGTFSMISGTIGTSGSSKTGYGIYNTGTMNLYCAEIYDNIYSSTTFNVKMYAHINGKITLGDNATINVLDYVGLTPEYSNIIVSRSRPEGTILTLNGSSVEPELERLNITGFDSGTYGIKAVESSPGVWNVMLEELNIYVRVNANGDVSATGDYILFGSYPKTIKADSVTIDESDVDKKGYYLGSDGNRYAKVVATPASDSDQQFSNQTTVVSGKTYYFKVEKIKWRILKTTNNKALLLAEDQLYGMFFDDEESDSNNYAESEVRAFLNGRSTTAGSSYQGNGFLQIAFTTAEQNNIQTITVDNSASTTSNSTNQYACENTTDKIFLLSYQESINSAYGFSENSALDTLRQQKATDFAVACGAYSNGCWWLRSPSSISSSDVQMVIPEGRSGDIADVHEYSFGVVPALWLDLGTGTSSFASNSELDKEMEEESSKKTTREKIIRFDSKIALIAIFSVETFSIRELSNRNQSNIFENRRKRKYFRHIQKNK